MSCLFRTPLPLRLLFALLCLTLLCSCASPKQKIWKEPEFTAPEAADALYIVPFASVLAPIDASEQIFDRFVDNLIRQQQSLDTQVVILKKELKELDSWWLKQQSYVTGEIFGYVEERGCCSTSIRLKARIELYVPQDETPSLRIEFPRETFFDHDYGEFHQERDLLLENLADDMSAQLLQTLQSTGQ